MTVEEKHLSWKSPAPLGKHNEYLLAMLLRILRNGNKVVSVVEGITMPPSVLMPSDVKKVARNYAYMSEMLRTRPDIETADDLFDAIVDIVSIEHQHRTWLRSHRKEVAAAEVELMAVSARDGRVGFTAWG